MRRSVVGFISIVFLVAVCPVVADVWPHLRGPNFDGAVRSTGALSADGVTLELDWSVALGSGYSGVVVADGRLATMYAAGGEDWIGVFDADDGKLVWRKSLGETYRGVDGADDGPLSSPVIDDGRVYALGPRGVLFAMSLEDGDLLWSKELPQDFSSVKPHFGFATTPLVDGRVLVVQTGGENGKAISGLDKKTGQTLWSLGDAKVDYQSPALLTLGGKRQVVAVTGKQLQGIDPANGKILWTRELGEEAYVESATPTTAGKDRLLIFVSGEAVVFEGTKKGNDFALDEVYRTRDLGGTYALPVFHDGHLYGFKRQFLTCVDAETGAVVWKSRPPGGRGLILVGDKLIVFGAEGNVVVVRATPEAYEEIARVQALDGSGYTWPAFADDRVFVRNLDRLAAVAVLAGTGDGEVAVGTAETPQHEFGRWVAAVEAAGDPQSMVEEFMKRHDRLPVVEGDWIHFVFRGEAEDVAIFGTMIPTGNPDSMQRVDGTDLYYRSYELEPAGRWEYVFLVDYDERVPDPNNPEQVPAPRGDSSMSVVTTAGYVEPSFLDEEPGEERGTLRTVEFESDEYDDRREITVYLPPGYEEGKGSYPLLIVHQGPEWIEKGLMVRSLDNLIGETVAPLVVAFVAPGAEWWLEAGGSQADSYAREVAKELVPFLSQKFRLIDDRSSRAVMGLNYYGLESAYIAWSYPQVFGKVALQSVSLGLGADDTLLEMIRGGQGADLRIYLDWNRYEQRDVDTDVDLAEDNRLLARAIEEGGGSYVGGEVLDSYGWGSWRARTDRILETLFPASKE